MLKGEEASPQTDSREGNPPEELFDQAVSARPPAPLAESSPSKICFSTFFPFIKCPWRRGRRSRKFTFYLKE